MIIYQLEDGVTANYATDELKKYIKEMCGVEAVVKYEKEAEEGIVLATFDTLGINALDIEDKKYDDAFEINIKGLKGYIAGSNIRSILYGIYDYLYAAGCRFLRPGKDGDLIPKKDMSAFDYACRKKADCRYRCDCIEGSLSYEMIDERLKWLPKAGYNGYLIQGLTPTFMLERWYKHIGNPYKEPKPLTWEEEEGLTRIIEKNIKKYGLLFHDYGHGYMFPAYGIYRDDEIRKIEEPLKSHIALTQGNREIKTKLKYVNLCYSNPDVRNRIANYLADYLEEKPDIDFLHMYLADCTENLCQCENCQKQSITDLYVMLLNDVDAELTKRNNDTKIVFCLYNDTLIPPKTERFNNPDRFVLETAVFRTVEDTQAGGYAIKVTESDNLMMVEEFAPIMRCQNAWRKIFKGDILFFDYHLYSEHFDDMGHDLITNRIVNDVKNIDVNNSKGLMNCATSRLYMPTGLPTYACGMALFDKSIDLESLKDDYFAAAFGADGAKVKAYLKTLSDLFQPDLLADIGVSAAAQEYTDIKLKAHLKWMNNPEANASFRKIDGVLAEFKPLLEKNLKETDGCQRKSWELLDIHFDHCKMLAEALVLGSAGDIATAQEKAKEIIDYLARREDDYALHFEFFLYLKRIRFMFGLAEHIWAALDSDASVTSAGVIG